MVQPATEQTGWALRATEGTGTPGALVSSLGSGTPQQPPLPRYREATGGLDVTGRRRQPPLHSQRDPSLGRRTWAERRPCLPPRQDGCGRREGRRKARHLAEAHRAPLAFPRQHQAGCQAHTPAPQPGLARGPGSNPSPGPAGPSENSQPLGSETGPYSLHPGSAPLTWPLGWGARTT